MTIKMCNIRIDLLLLIIMLLCLTGCKDKSIEIPSITELKDNLHSPEELTEKLEGVEQEDLKKAWGNPHWSGMGRPFDCWYIEGEADNAGDYIQVNYVDGMVSTVEYVSVFYATIVEIDENHILVEPLEEEWERNSSDRIIVGTKDTAQQIKERFVEGVVVRIGYDGLVMETYPAQINQDYIEICEE